MQSQASGNLDAARISCKDALNCKQESHETLRNDVLYISLESV